MIGYNNVLDIKTYAKSSYQQTYYLVQVTQSVNLVCLAELTHEVSDHEAHRERTLVNPLDTNSN